MSFLEVDITLQLIGMRYDRDSKEGSASHADTVNKNFNNNNIFNSNKNFSNNESNK